MGTFENVAIAGKNKKKTFREGFHIVLEHLHVWRGCNAIYVLMSRYSLVGTCILSSERMLHKEYDRKGSVARYKISGRDLQGIWRQNKLIGGKPPVVK
jgi:hypothetical protein